MGFEAFLQIAETAAYRAGELLRQMQGRCQVWFKGPKDVVSEADLAAQQLIRETLLGAYPAHGFLGEESQETTGGAENTDGFRWIVDPIDGTANFVHRLPGYAVSIALECRGEILVGVVFDPSIGECYSAARGLGAKLNGKPIRVSECQSISEAMVSASFTSNVQHGSEEIARFIEVLVASHSLRRLGSAALNLCYVGAGRLDAYWATSVKSWDVAAGVLIARESGATLTDLTGGPFQLSNPRLAIAANTLLHSQLLDVLRRATL